MPVSLNTTVDGLPAILSKLPPTAVVRSADIQTEDGLCELTVVLQWPEDDMPGAAARRERLRYLILALGEDTPHD